MTVHVTSRRVALAAAGGLLAALSLSGAAQAITDNIFRYATAKTGHFSIDVMAMAPDRADAANDYLISWSGILSTGNALCFNTDVSLPNGATMTRLSVWYTSGASSNPFVQLVRHALADGTSNVIAFQTIIDDSGTRKQRNLAIPNNSLAKVKSGPYTYGFGVCLGSDTVFHGARVTCTYTHAGD